MENNICGCGKHHIHKRGSVVDGMVDTKKAYAALALSLEHFPGGVIDRATAEHIASLQDKDLVLYGPEVVTLRNHMTAAFRELCGTLMDQLIQCFSVPNTAAEVSVNEARVVSLLKSLTKKMPEVWDAAQEVVLATLTVVYDKSKELMLFEEDITDNDSVTRAESPGNAWQQFMIKAMSDHLQDKFGRFPEDILGNYLTKLIKKFQDKPDATVTDRLQLMERLDILKNIPATYLEQLSDVSAGRVWAFTGIQYAMENGVLAYQIHGHMDAKICAVCFRLNGKIFSVEHLFEKMALFLNDPTNDKQQKELFPFYSVSDLDNREITPDEGCLPPLHVSPVAEDTEFLSQDGWKLVKDACVGDMAFSLNPDTGEVEWAEVDGVVSAGKAPNGRMVHFKSQNADLLVTEHHRQPFLHDLHKRSELDIQPAGDLLKYSKITIPRSGGWTGVKPDISRDMVEFLALWISDGVCTHRTTNGYQIRLCTQKYQDKAKQLFERITGKKAYKSAKYVGCHDTALGEYLTGEIGTGFLNKRIPASIMNADVDTIKLFLNTYLVADGHEYTHPGTFGEGHSKTFYTASSQLAAQIGELIVKAGGFPSYYFQDNEKMYPGRTLNGREIKGKHVIHRIRWNISKNATFGKNGKGEMGYVPYDGDTYCLSLKKNFIFYSRRKGKCIWTGNCLKQGTEIYTMSRGWIPIETVTPEDVILTLRLDPNARIFVTDTTKMIGKVTTYSKFGVGFIDHDTQEMIETTEDHQIPSWDTSVTESGIYVKMKAQNYINSRLTNDEFTPFMCGNHLITHPNLPGIAPEMGRHDYVDAGVLRIVPRKYDDYTPFVCIELEQHNNLLVRAHANALPLWIGNCRCNVTMLKKSKDPEAKPLEAPDTILNRLSMTPKGLRQTKIMELAAREQVDKLIVADDSYKTLISAVADSKGFHLTEDQVQTFANRNILQSSVSGETFTKKLLSFALASEARTFTLVTPNKEYRIHVKWDAAFESSDMTSSTEISKELSKKFDAFYRQKLASEAEAIADGFKTEKEVAQIASHFALSKLRDLYDWFYYDSDSLT